MAPRLERLSPTRLDRPRPRLLHHPTRSRIPTPCRPRATGPACSPRSCSGRRTSSGSSERPRKDPSGRRVVQLTPLGRYVLALQGPRAGGRTTRPSRHFLFVQPNFEIVAYRQGLTPGPDRRVQPVRPLVTDRRDAPSEADARESDLSGPRRRPHARSDDRPPGARAQATRPIPPSVADAVQTLGLARRSRSGRITPRPTLVEVRPARRPGAAPSPSGPSTHGDDRADPDRRPAAPWSRTRARSRSAGSAWPARATTAASPSRASRSSRTA